MEADLASKHRPIPGSFRGTRTPLHDIRVDAQRPRAKLRSEEPRSESIAIGVSV